MAFSTFSSVGRLIKSSGVASAPPYTLTDIISTTNLLYFYKFDSGDISNGKLLNYATNANDLTQVGTLTQTSIKKFYYSFF